MSLHQTATERFAALDVPEHSSAHLRAIAQAVREVQGRERGDADDPREQHRQVMRVTVLMCSLYGANAATQARKVSARFGSGTFARQVMAAVEFVSRAQASSAGIDPLNLLSASFPAEPTSISRA